MTATAAVSCSLFSCSTWQLFSVLLQYLAVPVLLQYLTCCSCIIQVFPSLTSLMGLAPALWGLAGLTLLLLIAIGPAPGFFIAPAPDYAPDYANFG